MTQDSQQALIEVQAVHVDELEKSMKFLDDNFKVMLTK
jgi:hypothetical protein